MDGFKVVSYDDKVPWLQVREGPSGRRYYYARWYDRDAKVQRRRAVGAQDRMSLAEARAKALSFVHAPEQKKKASITFGELWPAFYANRVVGLKDASGVVALWENHISPEFKNTPVDDLTLARVELWHREISVETPIAANRALTVLGRMVNYAIVRGDRSRPDICGFVKRNPENKRERYLSPEEIERVRDALLYDMAHSDDQRKKACLAIFLLLLTGARRGEICGQDIGRSLHHDGDARWLRVVDGKTGDRDIMLSAPAMTVVCSLASLRGLVPDGYYVKRVWNDICERARIEDCTLHDLRHTFASHALKNGLSLDEIGYLLGHKSANTTKRYSHLDRKAAGSLVQTTKGIVELPCITDMVYAGDKVLEKTLRSSLASEESAELVPDVSRPSDDSPEADEYPDATTDAGCLPAAVGEVVPD